MIKVGIIGGAGYFQLNVEPFFDFDYMIHIDVETEIFGKITILFGIW